MNIRPDVALAVLETVGRVTKEQCLRRTYWVQLRRPMPQVLKTSPKWSAL